VRRKSSLKKETERRRDEALKRALNTPPKPHKSEPRKAKGSSAKQVRVSACAGQQHLVLRYAVNEKPVALNVAAAVVLPRPL
jgi:hypothetical protein